MQEAEEQDTCRICSAPAEADQPLFHPCKCSGTIRYIHQDCLTTWLAHSKKKTCDVCKHPYAFTKVYAADMPSTLPPVLLVRRLAQHALFTLLFGVRAFAVAVIWLAVLPWATVWTWRMYFSMGESTAWWISDRPRPDPGSESSPYFYRVAANPPAPPPDTFVGRLTAHPLWIALSSDIFTGQIIASIIVLTFVAVFLLREWISQNARPGVFEDEDAFPEEAQPQPAPRPVQREAQPNPLDEALAQRQIEALRAIDTLRAREGINGHMVGDERHHHGRSPIERARRKAKVKEENEDPLNALDGLRAHNRRRLHPKGLVEEEEKYSEVERLKRRSFSRRVYAARLLGARRRAALTGSSHSQTPMNVDPAFDFTFKAELPQPGRRSNSEPWQKQSRSTDVDRANTATSPPTPIFPPVALEPPRGSIPFSFVRLKTPPPPPSPTPSADEGSSDMSGVDLGIKQSLFSSSLSHDKARRPPLPTTPLGPAASFVISPPRTPLDSPSLATYRAPEELEAVAGPSGLNGYFDREHEDNSEFGEDSETEEDLREKQAMNDQMDQYFEEVDTSGGRVSLPESMAYSDTEEGDEDQAEGDEKGESESDEDSIDDSDDEDDDEEDEADEEEANRLMLFNDDDWAIEVQVAAAGGPAEGPAAVQDEAEAGQPPGGGLDQNEEIEGNVEDDMDGAMEAIGMRGPLYGVLQNAALMIFVLDTAIGLGIWIPFTIGKSTALLSLDPQRFLQILHLPIRAMRVITDPIVDTVAFFVVDLLLPPILRLLRRLVAYLFSRAMDTITTMFGGGTLDEVTELFTKTGNRIAEVADKPLEQLVAWSTVIALPNTEKQASGALVFSKFEATFPNFINETEPYFAMLGKAVRIRAARTQDLWIEFALGEGPGERVFAVLLGYAVVGLLLGLYLNILTVGNAKSAGRAVRNAVRQQLLVLKVATFIFIELVTFPLACGVVLDLCTVWLFPEANLYSRAAFFFQAPLTAMFYHWVAGTLFMYSFAVLLSGCRTVMRTGAMWFVKDPQDQNAHPIRDILDRPTVTQLRKICMSGIMYSIVVACVVGSVAGLLLLGSKSIMPFRWKNREPLSNVPIDLLFLHLVLPRTMQHFRPKKAVKDLAKVIWKFLAARLRLTSYFFGDRHPDEEYTPNHWRVLSHRLPELLLDVNAVHDGSFRRVPATDHLALPRDVRATAAVTENGEPVDDAARALIALQNAEAEKAKRNAKDDYIVVYIPPHFRERLITFIALLWVVGAFLLGVAVALPIQLGRSFFALFISREVHDGYSFIIGFYLLWCCYLIGIAIDHLDKRRQRISSGGPRADLRLLVVKRGLLWTAKAIYMIIFLGIIIPTLVAFVVDLYVVLPIRFTLHPEVTPRIRVVDAWALGLLYAKIAIHANRIQPQNRITMGIQHIMDNGWTLLNPVQATTEVIGPVTAGLLGMIFIPGAVFRCIQYLLPSMHVDDKFIFLHVYPGIFMTAGLVRSSVVLYGMLSKWSQSIRDKEFLVEMRLRNHEPEKVNVKGGNIATPRITNGRDAGRHDN